MGEELLTNPGGSGAAVWRDGGVVYRQAGVHTGAVLGLLGHLERVGYRGAPRPVGDGFAADGRMAVSYLPGSSPHPAAWDDEAVVGIGELLRELHVATSGYTPPADAVWQSWYLRDLPGDDRVLGHCDTGPWNVVARGGRPVGFIDWEYAGPVDALWELAQTVWLNAQLHDDDIAERHQLPDAASRARQARLLVDGYRLAPNRRGDLLDKLLAVAVHAARAEAVNAAVTPESSDAVDEHGYPILWAITWRARSAAWMLRHRPLLERALT